MTGADTGVDAPLDYSGLVRGAAVVEPGGRERQGGREGEREMGQPALGQMCLISNKGAAAAAKKRLM